MLNRRIRPTNWSSVERIFYLGSCWIISPIVFTYSALEELAIVYNFCTKMNKHLTSVEGINTSLYENRWTLRKAYYVLMRSTKLERHTCRKASWSWRSLEAWEEGALGSFEPSQPEFPVTWTPNERDNTRQQNYDEKASLLLSTTPPATKRRHTTAYVNLDGLFDFPQTSGQALDILPPASVPAWTATTMGSLIVGTQALILGLIVSRLASNVKSSPLELLTATHIAFSLFFQIISIYRPLAISNHFLTEIRVYFGTPIATPCKLDTGCLTFTCFPWRRGNKSDISTQSNFTDSALAVFLFAVMSLVALSHYLTATGYLLISLPTESEKKLWIACSIMTVCGWFFMVVFDYLTRFKDEDDKEVNQVRVWAGSKGAFPWVRFKWVEVSEWCTVLPIILIVSVVGFCGAAVFVDSFVALRKFA